MTKLTKHPFVAISAHGPCSSCGRLRSDVIHRWQKGRDYVSKKDQRQIDESVEKQELLRKANVALDDSVAARVSGDNSEVKKQQAIYSSAMSALYAMEFKRRFREKDFKKSKENTAKRPMSGRAH